MKTKIFISSFIIATLLLSGCKKDGVQLLQETISITDVPNWVFEDGASRIKVVLSAEDLEKIQRAVGLVEVIIPTFHNVSNKVTLPHTTVYEGGVRITYYYEWEGSILNLYRQISGNAILVAGPPSVVDLVYYVVK